MAADESSVLMLQMFIVTQGCTSWIVNGILSWIAFLDRGLTFRWLHSGVKWMWELHTQRSGGIIGDEMVRNMR